MARTNLSVLPDVSGCLRDAMDAMFNNGNQNRLNNNGHTVVTPDDSDVIVDVVNDDDQSSLTDALQSSINKRKLANNGVINHEHNNQNGNDSTKRLCTMNEHQ